MVIFLSISIAQSQSDKHPINELTGEFKAHLTVNFTRNDSDGKPEETSLIEYDFTCTMELTSALRRIEGYKKNPKSRFECGPNLDCPILTGHSYFVERDKIKVIGDNLGRYPLTVIRRWKTEGYKWVGDERKWVTTSKGEAEITNTYQNINLKIQTFFPSEDMNIPASLAPNYVLTFSGASYTDRINPGKFPNHGKGSGKIWDDEKHQLIEDPGPFDVSVPFSTGIDRKKVDEDGLKITPLLISDCNGLDEFLLNPNNLEEGWHYKGIYRIDANAKSIQSSNPEETVTNLEVQLILKPGIKGKN
jgi:hypothetical protein